MKQILTLLFLCLFSSVLVFGQASGEIQGKVTDAKSGEPIPFANVNVTINGALAGVQTDFDGFYSIKPIPAGEYTVKVSFVGYATQQIEKVLVRTDKITFLDVQLKEEGTVLNEVEIVAYKVPLLQADETATGGTITKEEIQNLPTRNVQSIASQTAGVYQADEGSNLNVRGARAEATDYYIDGIKVRGSSTLPASAIEQLSVITGGLPARYGDATGGVINITTRGPSSTFSGGIELVTSKFLEAYDYNLANFSLAGPIAKIGKDKSNRRTLLGFFVSGEYLHEKDDDPSAVGIWKVKDDVLADITATPLVRSENNTGFTKVVDLLTAENFEKVKAKRNVTKDNISLAGKIDFQPVTNINFVLGGNLNIEKGGAVGRSAGYRDLMRRYEVYNWEHSPLVTANVYRGYARFTQRFANPAPPKEGETRKASPLQNAYYSVQFDYTRSTSKQKDPIFGDNLFEYGYAGKFKSYGSPIFQQQKVGNLQGWTMVGYADTLVTYEAGGVNPEKDAHNLNYFALAGDDGASYYSNIFQILNNGGYINGDYAGASLYSAYNLTYVPGTPWGSYGFSNNDQYRLTFNGSFDLKKAGSERNKHAIEFGFEYEQRIDREFFLAPEQLWRLMFNNVGRYGNGIGLDLANPILLIDGQQIPLAEYNGESGLLFSENDSIIYNLTTTGQSYFDKQFRDKFGYSTLQFADVYSHSPDEYSLDMLSPDELSNDGNNSSYTYAGYDYTGNSFATQPDFQDYWTAFDAEKGIYTRPLGAFRPIYMAGFVQDKFAFKDLIFNIGVRVDRFDANQKVPKDIYSPLYGVKTASEVTEFGAHPTTVGDDYVVYVDSEEDPTAITGYRSGNQWYNKDGLAVEDPRVLQTGTQTIPYLIEGQLENGHKTPNYNTSLAFTDYNPQISVSPRVAFSFELSENAIFFAHYDVLAQRPQDRFIPTAKDYYFFEQTVGAGGVIDNPNLKPERTIDYQIGFKQKLSKTSALTISGFYRELKDMVQLYRVNNTYPVNGYNTYNNIDFGTVKGFDFNYDLRRTQNLRMTFNYTLQFADGTGSGDRSQANLIDFGRPNLRSIFPLSYDSRHLINVSADYGFGGGKDYNGPKLFGKNILSYTNLNVILRARSGEPYTQQANPTPEAQFGVRSRGALDGTINGSRLPFNFRIDARLEKEFKFKTNGDKNAPGFSVYVLTQNLLNTQNIIGVYSYTGSALDDGFISSAQGQEIIASQTNAQAFIDQYRMKIQDPNNYSIPRRIRVGAILTF